MSLLAKISKGKQVRAAVNLIYGIRGVGKTSFAAEAPNPLILDLEDGSSHLDVARLTMNDGLSTYESFFNTVKELSQDPQGYQTLVVDSMESVESLMYQRLLQEGSFASMDAVQKFDSGAKAATGWMRELMNLFKSIANDKNVEVILIGHSHVVKYKSPDNEPFDRYTMRLNPYLSQIVMDISHNVLFANHVINTAKSGRQVKGISDGERILKTQWNAAYDAKNRDNLPEEIPLSYTEFKKACENSTLPAPEVLKAEIKELSKGLSDPDKKKRVEEILKQDLTSAQLNETKNKLKLLVA
jgi:hypothetical protein